MKIKVEKGLPIPDEVRGLGYPFEDLTVGDSFAVPSSKKGSARAAMNAARKETKRKFVSRTVIENGVEVIRFWRLS